MHIFVEAAEAVLDKEFPVLDKGFVRLVDYQGSDSRIVQAARVSYGAGTKSVSDDAKLINYLMRNRHTSPFEMVSFTFHVKMPIFVARQWLRHRTASVNEYSGRYSVMPDEFYVPEYARIQGQSKKNKQASDGELPGAIKGWAQMQFAADQSHAYTIYEEMLGDGISRELARINLPLSNYTQFYWNMDLHNLFGFIKLRMDEEHPQFEIREYAKTVFDLVKLVCPIASAAFEEHIMYAKTLSRTEWEKLNK